MENAINIVKKHDPLHKDVGTYNNVLGTERQVAIKRKLLLTPIRPAEPEHIQNINHQLDYAPIGDARRPTERYDY